MKNGKIKKKMIILYILAALALGGCGKEDISEGQIETITGEDIPVKESSEEERKQEQEAETDQNAQGIPKEKEAESSLNKDGSQSGQGAEQKNMPESAGKDPESARMQKYRAVLADVLEKQIYPDGTDCGFDGTYSMSGNKFAVFDVDKDGRKELILSVTTTSMAGMRMVVYDYDEKADAVREEYSGFPSVTFYDNGQIEEGLSHNQGMAPLGDFWPYMLHRYQPEADKYQCVFWVDAWEKAFREEDYNGNPYPEEIDQEKSGTVYFVMEGENYDLSTVEPVGKSDYEKWRKDQGLESAKTELPFQELTKENIEKI